jgi:hypothetical protein
MIKLALQEMTAATLIVVAIRQTVQLRHHPDDLPLRALAPGLICVAIDSTVNIPGSPLQDLGHQLLGHAYPLLANFLWAAMAYCFATFFVVADPNRPRARRVRFAQIGLGVLLVSTLIQALLPALHPTAYGRGAAGQVDYRDWAVLLGDPLYSAVDLAFWTVGLVGAVRYVRALEHPWLRGSVRVVCLGVVGMAEVDLMSFVKDTIRAVEDVHYPEHYPITTAIYITGLLGGQAALAVGLVLPVIAAPIARLVRRYERAVQSRYSAQMRPLWEVLTAAFPYVVLPDDQRGEQPAGHDPQADFERLTTEITDSLAQLAPFYGAAGLSSTNASTGMRDPTAAAKVIRAALRLREAGADRAEPPFPRMEPDHHNWRRRARWMIRISRALKDLDPSSPARAVSTPS